jgi:hypothetical protein
MHIFNFLYMTLLLFILGMVNTKPFVITWTLTYIHTHVRLFFLSAFCLSLLSFLSFTFFVLLSLLFYLFCLAFLLFIKIHPTTHC